MCPLAGLTFGPSLGLLPLVFDHGIAARVDNSLMTVLSPPHFVRRLAMLPANLHDFGVPFAFTDAMALDNQ